MTAKISVGTSAFTMGAYAEAPIPFENVVARLGELGYDGLELPANEGYGSLEDWPDTASRKKLVRLVRGAGLEFSSYGADLSPSPYYSDDPAVNTRTHVKTSRRNADSSSVLKVELPSRGGQAIRIVSK